MYISRVKLSNWKNFKDVDVELQRRTFLVGPNASGKSNFLDAIRFLHDIAHERGGFQQAVHDRGGYSKIKCLAATSAPGFAVEIELSEEEGEAPPEWSYRIEVRKQTRGNFKNYVKSEIVKQKEEVILERAYEDGKDAEPFFESHLEQVQTNKDFRPLRDYLRGINYLHIVPQIIKYREAFPKVQEKANEFGANFIEALAKEKANTRSARLRKIEEAMKGIVPQLESFEYIKDDMGVPHLQALFKHWRPKAGKQLEDQLSDGTLRLIGLFWMLLSSKGTLLLEEPELSLNEEIVRRLPGLFARARRKKKKELSQTIISTHSYNMLSDKGVAPEEVLLLNAEKDNTVIQSVNDVEEMRRLIESGFSVGSAYESKASATYTGRTKKKGNNQLTLGL